MVGTSAMKVFKKKIVNLSSGLRKKRLTTDVTMAFLTSAKCTLQSLAFKNFYLLWYYEIKRSFPLWFSRENGNKSTKNSSLALRRNH